MKKAFKLLTLAMIFAMPLAGCKDNDKPKDNDDPSEVEEDENEEEEEEGGGGSGGGGGGQTETKEVVFDFSKISAVSGTVSGVSFEADIGGGQTPPTVSTSGFDLRIYAKGELTVSASSNMTKIDFAISSQGKKRQAEIACSTGKMTYSLNNSLVSWTGNASNVVFTVGDKATYGSESSKAGQFCFTSMTVSVGEGGGSGGGGSGGGGGGGQAESIEDLVSSMADKLCNDPTWYEYDSDDECYYIDYYDDIRSTPLAAVEYVMSCCPSDFYAYDEPDEYEDDEGEFSYGSYINDDMFSVDAYAWEEDGDICVSVEIYEFEWEEE